jgi:putative transposase
MTNNLAHTIRLYPNKAQETFFRKACGCARVAYNYGLCEYQKQRKEGHKPNILEIKKRFNADKKVLFPWMSETNKDANQQPFANLQSAFSRFFKKHSKYPVFKKKGRKDSFYISNDKFGVEANNFWIPKLGWVKGAEELRFKGKIMSATVKRKADYWFVVVSVETDKTFTACDNQAVVGVDLGIKTLATLSDGKVVEAVKPLRARLARLKLLQRWASRKVLGSSNRHKANLKVAKIHYKVACLRKDVLDKLTTYLCENYRVIVVEDLNISGMLKNHCLALAISDCGFGEFRRQLEYKSILHGNTLVVADRFFPSSKTCSGCGTVKETLILSEREFVCENCGQVLDRDLNAAINLRNYGLEQLRAASPEITPADKEALVYSSSIGINETILDEAGISGHLLVLTQNIAALYTGITLDVQARIAQHNSGKGAKALLALGRPVTLQWHKIEGNKSDALKLEAAIKKKTRAEKLKII